MTEVSVLPPIIHYTKTREVYTTYRKAGYSKKFYEENRILGVAKFSYMLMNLKNPEKSIDKRCKS